MGLNARKIENRSKTPSQEPLEAGTYPSRLVQVISLGVQKQRPYQGQEKEPVDELYVTYESTDEFCVDEEGNIQEDKPRWFSETFPFYSLDAENAKSTKRYYAIDPKEVNEGDWSALLGEPVMVTLTATEGKNKNAGKVFNNIAGISAMRAKQQEDLPKLVNSTKMFDFYEPDVDVFMSLPKWLQTKIKEAVNFEGSDLQDAIANYKEPNKSEQDEGTASDGDSPEDGSNDSEQEEGGNEEW